MLACCLIVQTIYNSALATAMASATFLAPNKATSGDSLFTTVSRYSAALGIILPSGLVGPFEQQGPGGGYFSSGALKPAGV
ncbi:MAG: hypothetical protein IKS62_04425 [Aeriscardovia sp.]|nr:hypothetical protein [Aeriscardovia sp.]